ncbi:SusC/RagA family TonB-linked outer membrane protein [Phnomibacter ginsenosidimutans]|nr:SusC/RagA family TonB-linked outer membrane protein [Phnomibacter ginsenosidimutans]
MKILVQPLRKSLENRAIMLLLMVVFATGAFAQTFSVTGQIKDEKSMPLPGVAILNNRTQAGTSSNQFGQFSIEAQKNDVLTFSFIGKATQTIKVNGDRLSVNLVMVDTANELGDVVVTALGIKRQEKALGYATQTVKGSTLQTVKGVDVATSLTGRVAGLLVRNSPEFAAEPNITLRGETVSPLIVIDGVPYGSLSLRDVPADDIETINVLKGPTASALYGERGGNGAIMITTKRGAAGRGLSVSFNSSSMFEAGYLAIPEMQGKYGRVVNTATNTYVGTGDGAWGPALEGQSVIQWDPISKTMKAMPYLPVGANNFKNFQQQGSILNNNLSIAQSGDMGGFRASATWVNNKGTYPNSKFDKVTYSVGGDIRSKKFSLSTSLAYNNHRSPNLGFSGYTGYDPMYGLLIWGSPDWNINDYKDYWTVPNEIQNNSYTAGNNNPFFDRYERIRTYNKDLFNGQITLNYDILPWLKVTARTGYDTYSATQNIRVSKGSFQGAGATTMIPGGTEVWGEAQRGSYNQGISRGFSSNTEGILSANRKWKDFSIDGFVGGSIYYKQDEGLEARTRGGLSIPGYYSLKASIDPVITASSVAKRQTNSLFGKLGIGWKNIAFVEGTFRNDWVSTLPEATRSFLYPSVAGSLVLSELTGTNSLLSFWKLRGSWTQYKKPANIYSINQVYGIATNQWGTLPTASYPTTIRPDDIFAESFNTTEIGTYASFLKNRLSLDVTLYSKKGYDFIQTASISPSTGFTGVFINNDEERTRQGIEVTLGATPVKTKDMKWDIALNWATSVQKYTQMDATYSIKGREWIGVGKRTDYYTYNEYQTDNQGNIVFNNGVPTYKPIASLAGYTDPDWIWGINSSFNYKQFTLNVAFDGRVGGLAQSITEMYMWRSGNHPNSLTEERYLDAKTPGSKNFLGQGVKVVSGSIVYDANLQVVSDTRVFAPNDVYTTYKSYIEALHKGTAWGGSPSPVDLYTTTFFKLRELSLTYQFDNKVASKIAAKGISVSLVAQNLLYWAKQFKYSDIDGGSENFADPSMRYIGMNFRFDF